jgi:hypothetical protein
MFTYNLTDKTIENGRLRVTIEYTNGTVNVSETFSVVTQEELDNKITRKLAELEGVVELSKKVIIGNYTKTEKLVEEPKEPTELERAEQAIWELKRKIDLGVMKESDQEFIDAVTAYKTLMSK